MNIKVVKLSPYPKEIPTEIAVGFQVSFNNGRNRYVDTLVDLHLTEEEAVEEAYNKLKTHIEYLQETVGSLPTLIGKNVFFFKDGGLNIGQEEDLEDLEYYEDIEFE